MSGSYNQTTHDALNGDSSHFDADPFYNNDTSSFPNMDPNLTTEGVENLSNTAAAANEHLASASPSTSYNAMLGNEMDTETASQGFGPNNPSIPTVPVKIGKASRACDECRRRKSKCTDGNPETGQACAPCRARGGPDAECHYNRTPMKRGPSKGYIQAMKGNVDDVSRGQRRVLSHVDYLKIELEAVKDQLAKVVDFVTKKFGEDVLEPALSRDEIVKRVRFSDTIPDAHILSLNAQKAVAQYQMQFQNVLPFLPTDPMVLQNILEESTDAVQKAFELALCAIDTPVYSLNIVDQARADLIERANNSLMKQAYTPLYLATVGILMLAIQTTGPVSEYKGKLPNMLALHDKAISAYAALHPFEETNPRPAEISNYVRSVAIGIRSLLLITSIGSGEIFGIIDQISIPSTEDTTLVSESAYRFGQLAETFHDVLRAGLSSMPIQFENLNLYDAALPTADYKVVASTLSLLITRLNTFSEFPDTNEVIRNLNKVIDSLYLFTLPEDGSPYAPSCWLYYHGLALAVKTAFDLSTTYEMEGDSAAQAALGAVEKLKEIINHLPVGVLSGWEQAAMNTLNRFTTVRLDHSTSSGKWRHLLAKDAYLRALDF